MNTQEALRMAISYIEGDKAWLHLKDDVLNACKEALNQEKDDTKFWENLQSEVDENGY